MVFGGDHHGKILFIHEDATADPLPMRPTTYMRADDFDDGRNSMASSDLDELYTALDRGGVDDDGDYDDDDVHYPPRRRVDPRLAPKLRRGKELARERMYREINLPVGTLRIVPQAIRDQREYVYAPAASGAGKSFLAGQFAEMYHKVYPQNRIFVLSKKQEDSAFDRHPFIQRIDLDEEFAAGEPLEPKDFANSLTIFDDCQNLPDGKGGKANILAAVEKLRDNLAEMGRSEGVTIFEANHLGMNYRSTRVSLNECDGIYLFKNGSSYHNRRMLKEYIGLDAKTIQKILSLPSRFFFVKKTFPRYCVSEHSAFLLD
jgi:hypothetical protein